MTDGLFGFSLGHAGVGPKVASTYRRREDPNDSVARFGDGRFWDLAQSHLAGGGEHSRSHRAA
jgi:hypothetical protein